MMKVTVKSPLNFIYGTIEIPYGETLNYVKEQVKVLTLVPVKNQQLYNETNTKLDTENLSQLKTKSNHCDTYGIVGKLNEKR
jgi:hypothetical protein